MSKSGKITSQPITCNIKANGRFDESYKSTKDSIAFFKYPLQQNTGKEYHEEQSQQNIFIGFFKISNSGAFYCISRQKRSM